MSAIDIVFGVKIILSDHGDPVTGNAGIGLYNISSLLTDDFTDEYVANVVDGSLFSPYTTVTISDDDHSETGFIVSISGNDLTFATTSQHWYKVSRNGKITAGSYFGWLQNDITGVSGWKSGMIVENGIGKWTKKINLKKGGNISQAGSGSVAVKNTAKFWNTLQTAGIYLNGLTCEIHEFQNTIPTRVWSGICEKPNWDSKKYTIPFKGFLNKRISNVLTLINKKGFPNASGDILSNDIPVTIGEIRPAFDIYDNVIYNGYGKFVRTADKEEKFETADFNEIGDYVMLGNPVGVSVFPVVGDDGNDTPQLYKIKLALTGNAWYRGYTFGVSLRSGTSFRLADFEGDYLDIVEGGGQDEFRKIDHAFIDPADDPTILQARISDYFEENLVGNSQATAEDNTWLTIDKIHRQYQDDVWPCVGYINSQGVTLTQALELYAHTGEKIAKVTTENTDAKVEEKPIQFVRLPEYAYEDSGEGDNNTIDIDVKLFRGNSDQMDSFLVLPVKNIELVTDLHSVDGIPASAYKKVKDGLFVNSGSSWLPQLDLSWGSLDWVITKNYNLGAQYDITYKDGSISLFALDFDPPDFPKNFDFDSVYLGIKMKVHPTTAGSERPVIRTALFWERFIGAPHEIMNEIKPMTISGGWIIESLPDFYYVIGPNTLNQHFYVIRDHELINEYYVSTGYKTFETTNISKEDLYNSIYKMHLYMRNTAILGSTEATYRFTIYELALIFKKSISIKEAIYSPVKGRKFNNTWEGRKSVDALIKRPISTLEHFNRLQCWSESSPIPSAGWGLGYSTGAKIKTGTTASGSFDNTTDANFTVLNDYECANQILKKDAAYTDKLKRSICRDYFLASWVDKDGYECVKRIIKSSTTPPDTVTLADIVDRRSIKITEPSPADIYPEPFVRYRKNFATGEYEAVIRISNVDADTYSSDYVEGITGSSAEIIWQRCHDVLWPKARHLEKPPSDMTDKQWFNSIDAPKLAREYILNWIDWMFNPICTFKVHYNKAGRWEEAHRFNLRLPHQTNDAVIECILTKITIDPNPPYHVQIDAIMQRETIPDDFFIKDTWVDLTGAYSWKDTTTLYGTDADKKDNT